MAAPRLVSSCPRLQRTSVVVPRAARCLTTSSSRRFEPIQQPKPPAEPPSLNSRAQDTAKRHREIMKSKALNPHMTSTTSTLANEFPSVGADKPPADMLTSVDPEFVPQDSVPENTKRMTGGTQAPGPDKGPNAELGVGEIEGGKFKVDPLRRSGEKEETLRARLIYQSRKRGTLESDLLLSTFADAHLSRMTYSQMEQYDLFLDENDWDIYYWATQQSPATAIDFTEVSSRERTSVNPANQKKEKGLKKKKTLDPVKPAQGEWSQTVGAFKPAYRPVPARWKNSEILSMLRQHVIDNSAGVVHEQPRERKIREPVRKDDNSSKGAGLGFMPELRDLNAEARNRVSP